MKTIFREFGIVLMLTAALLVALITSCAPERPAARAGVSSASLVTIMRKVAATPESALDGSARDRFVPHCTAFAVRRLGRVQIATAAHCVSGAQVVRYVPPDGIGLPLATVQYISEARDVAYLDCPSDGLVPLEIGPAPGDGESVRAFSSLYRQTSLGRVITQYEGGWYETNQTIVYGWSGAPVVDGYGRAVGVVSRCPAPLGGQCMPGHALVAGL